MGNLVHMKQHSCTITCTHKHHCIHKFHDFFSVSGWYRIIMYSGFTNFLSCMQAGWCQVFITSSKELRL